jgi:hypothetical protein
VGFSLPCGHAKLLGKWALLASIPRKSAFIMHSACPSHTIVDVSKHACAHTHAHRHA